MLPFTFDTEVLTVAIGADVFQIKKSDPNFGVVMKALKTRDDQHLLDVISKVRKLNVVREDGRTASVEVRDGDVYLNGELIVNEVTDRISLYIDSDLPHEPLLKFLENLMLNPSFNSRKELFRFLDHKNMPITDDGCFLAYKAIREDWTDKHSGQFSNRVGDVNEMPRANVDDDCHRGCSVGFHVGTVKYATDFASGKDDRLILVKVNPRDAVAVPHDCESQKLRVCRYEVVDVYSSPLHDGVYRSEVNSTVSLVVPKNVFQNVLDDVEDMVHTKVKDYLRDYDYVEEDEDEEECEYCGWDDCHGECEECEYCSSVNCDGECEDEEEDNCHYDRLGRPYNKDFLSQKAKDQKRGKGGRFKKKGR